MNNYQLVNDSIKLLNGAPIFNAKQYKLNKHYYSKALNAGIYIEPQILTQLNNEEQISLIEWDLINKYGITTKELQSTFIKTFAKAEEMTSLEMLVHQLLHYASTYGNIDMLKNDGDIYTPEQIEEKEQVQQFVDNEFKTIKLLSNDEFLTKLKVLIESVMPFSSKDIESIVNLYRYAYEKYSLQLPEKIGNKELRVRLQYDMLVKSGYKMVPKKSDDFMRLLIYVMTHSTLVVKDKNTLNHIKAMSSFYTNRNANENILDIMLNSYQENYGLVELAKSFNRYKPFYLAMKNDKQPNVNKIVNKIAKLSKTHHKPMKLDIMGNAIQYLIQADDKSKATYDIIEKIKNVETYQLIKLFNIIRIKLNQINSGKNEVASLYKIRNGKTFVQNKEITLDKDYIQYLELIKSSIIIQLKVQLPHLFNNVYYLPESIEYTMPTSTKSFIGDLIPDMSRLKVNGNFAIGIHWKTDGDIDLSGHNFKTNEYISWHSGHKGQAMVYSGDMTGLDRNGQAHESILVKDSVKDPLVFSQSLYSVRNGNQYIDAKLVISEHVDINNYQNAEQAKVVLPFKSTYDAHNFIMTIPLDNDDTEIVFTETSNGGRIVANKELSEISYDAIKSKIDDSLTIREFLTEIGVKILDWDAYQEYLEDENKDKLQVIDFSINKVSKQDFINLLKKEEV